MGFNDDFADAKSAEKVGLEWLPPGRYAVKVYPVAYAVEGMPDEKEIVSQSKNGNYMVSLKVVDTATKGESRDRLVFTENTGWKTGLVARATGTAPPKPLYDENAARFSKAAILAWVNAMRGKTAFVEVMKDTYRGGDKTKVSIWEKTVDPEWLEKPLSRQKDYEGKGGGSTPASTVTADDYSDDDIPF